jgi:HlyD family secretion protein
MLSTRQQDEIQSRWRWCTDQLRSIKIPETSKETVKRGLSHAWQWRYRATAALSVLAVIWYAGIPLLLGPVTPVEAVKRVDLVQSVVASGHVEAEFRVNIGSQITGVVKDIPVAEGQTVKAGEVLVVLDDREVRAAVVQAEGIVAQAEAKLRQMRELTLPSAKETLEQAKATLINAQQTYDRAQKLAADGFATKASLGDALKALDIARAQVRNGELQVFTNQPGGSDYVSTETLLNQARAGLVAAQSRLSYTVIVAPRDGVLISRDVERGNIAQPANVLMKLSPSGDTLLVVQIDEKNLGLIALGQTALASSDAFAKESFPARVVYINPGIDLQRASVEVKLLAASPPAYLRQDMTVSVDIEVARRPGALVVPVSSVRGSGRANPTVLKVVDGYAKSQPVIAGLMSAGKIEIIDGLKEGDLVLSSPAGVKDGARIRAQAATGRAP